MRRIITRSAVAIVLVMMSIMALTSCTQEANLAESEEPLTPTEEPQSETPSTAASQPESTTSTANGLIFEFISVTNPAKIKDTITIVGKTSPGAECKLVMTLANGNVSGFPKDPVKVADDDGNVKWEWVLFRFTPAGETKIEVTASLEGSSTTTTTSFTAVK